MTYKIIYPQYLTTFFFNLLFSFSSQYEIDKDTKCSAVGCPGTNLDDLNTYFSEYVLEQSNASNYFNVYVAGFTFAPMMSPMSMPSNMTNVTNSSGVDPGKKRPDTETTLWYSNEVKITETVLFLVDLPSGLKKLLKSYLSNLPFGQVTALGS